MKVYMKTILLNVKLDEVNKILIDFISTHNKNFDFLFINCEFVIEFDDNFIAIIKTNYFYNKDNVTINR